MTQARTRSSAITVGLCAVALASTGYAPAPSSTPGGASLGGSARLAAIERLGPIPCEAYPLHDFPPRVLALPVPPAIDLDSIRAMGALGHPAFGSRDGEIAAEIGRRPLISTVVVRARVGERGNIVIVRGPEHLVDGQAVGSLARELRHPAQLDAGTQLRLVYRVAGDSSASAQLMGLEVGSGATARRAFYVDRGERWPAGFYARDGKPVAGGFLRFPVPYVRITSRFSEGRHHPILKRRKPHYGVDFAAYRGTPVVSIADGDISAAGWDGGNGRVVRITHVADYESGYSHLHKIADGIRPGTRVRKGQIIGYVGSTGLSTGPHLHFALSVAGRYIDPLGAEVPRTPSLDGARLATLRTDAARAEEAWDAAERRANRAVRLAHAQ